MPDGSGTGRSRKDIKKSNKQGLSCDMNGRCVPAGRGNQGRPFKPTTVGKNPPQHNPQIIRESEVKTRYIDKPEKTKSTEETQTIKDVAYALVTDKGKQYDESAVAKAKRETEEKNRAAQPTTTSTVKEVAETKSTGESSKGMTKESRAKIAEKMAKDRAGFSKSTQSYMTAERKKKEPTVASKDVVQTKQVGGRTGEKEITRESSYTRKGGDKSSDESELRTVRHTKKGSETEVLKLQKYNKELKRVQTRKFMPIKDKERAKRVARRRASHTE